MTPETIQRLVILRQKMMDKSATKEELKEAIRVMREDRVSAAASSSPSRKKAVKAAIPAASDLLKELGSL